VPLLARGRSNGGGGEEEEKDATDREFCAFLKLSELVLGLTDGSEESSCCREAEWPAWPA
jgi:hypothetical protein